MIRFFLRSLAAHYRAGRSLFVLTLLGVALGVASVLSIQMINLNALGAFEGSVRSLSGEADLTVLGRLPTFAEELYPEVLSQPGVARAWPIYRVEVALAGAADRYLQVVGLDLFAPVDLPWNERPEEAAEPLSVAGWAAVSPRWAEERGLATGDRFEVTSGIRRVELRIGALIDFREVTPLAGDRLVVMDIAQAQALFGDRGRIHQIDLRIADGVDRERLRRTLEARLGPEVYVRTPEQRERQASRLLSAFRLNLTALSLISLFVGAFLVYTSTQASLVRRRNEFGLLRSIGATRAQIVGLILAEVCLLGAGGVLVGVPLGYLAAAANLDVVSATLTNLYLLEEIHSLRLPGWLFGLAAAIGVGGAAAGALLPALDLGRRDTRSLLAAYTVHERARVGARPLALAGCAVLAAGALLLAIVGERWRPIGFVVGVCLLVGLPLTTAWWVRQVTRRIGGWRFGAWHGVKVLGLRLQTVSFAVAALGVAVSMLIGITLMIGSFRRTVEVWIDQTLRADIYITTESWARARSSATLDPSLIDAIAATPGVAEIDRLRQFFGWSGERRISLVGVDMGLAPERARFRLLQGDRTEALRAARQLGAVIVSEPLARKAGLAVGDRLPVAGPEGELLLPIAGISYDYSDESGGAAMDLATMERLFGPGQINNIALYLDGPAGGDRDEAAERMVDRLRSRFPDLPLAIRSNRTLRREVFRIFDQTFAVTRLLQAMSLIIAACGITLTLLVLARERVSELALYRALGASRRQIFAVFLGKGLGIAAFGIALGSAGGLALAWILIFLINRAYFGWTIAVHWPLAALVGQVLTIVAVALLASVYPALRASRTPAVELSRENL